jgi:hypothetical protein
MYALEALPAQARKSCAGYFGIPDFLCSLVTPTNFMRLSVKESRVCGC